MTIYFESINDRNKVAIDDATPRLCVTKSGVLSSVATLKNSATLGLNYLPNHPIAGKNIRTYTLTLGTNEEFVGIRLTTNFSQYATIYQMQQGKSVFFVLMSLNSNQQDLSVQANNVYIYVFGKKDSDNVNHFGLSVLNELGKEIFHSSDKYLDVRQMGTYSRIRDSITMNDTSQFKTLNVSTTNQAIVCQECPQIVHFLGSDVVDLMYPISQNNGVYGIREIAPLLTNANMQYIEHIGILKQVSYIVVDVTNY